MDGWRSEIVDLHVFFEGWLGGTLPDDDATFARVGRVLAPGFILVTPGGVVLERGELLAGLRDGHGSRPGLEIGIEDPLLRSVSSDVVVTTYVERHRVEDKETRRLSSALFRTPAGGGPWMWLHVHETWLPADVIAAGDYSF